MPDVWWITGTARSNRSDLIDRIVLDNLSRTLLIVPTESHARERARGLVRKDNLPGIIGEPVLTFKEFAERIRAGTGLDDPLLEKYPQRLLLQRALYEALGDPGLAEWGGAIQSDGFLSHLQAVIQRIKQGEIQPEAFRTMTAERNVATDKIVVAVYSAYHELLQANRVVDLEGMYWLARLACPESPGLDPIETIVFDSFDDFTASEFSLVKAAADRVDTMGFGLNLVEEPRQKDLYTVPANTLQRIRDTFELAQCREVAVEPDPDSASSFVSQGLLSRDEPRKARGLRTDVEFIRCHSRDHEIATVARHVKALLREGVPPSVIAVVSRRVESVAEIVRNVFREVGVPVRGVETYSLEDSAFVNTVLHVAETESRWTPRFVHEMTTSPWLAADLNHTDMFPLLLRMASCRPERSAWLDAVERLAERVAEENGADVIDLLCHVPQAGAAIGELQAALQRLDASILALNAEHSLAGMAGAIETQVDAWPVSEALTQLPDKNSRALEQAAIGRFLSLLATMDRWPRGDKVSISQADLVRDLRTAVSMTEVRLDQPRVGVDVVDMERARYHRYRHVFVVGLTQGEVPSLLSPSAVYSESERVDLDRRGIPFDDAHRHSLKEVLLFQRMFYTARERLYLCWHELSGSGQVVGRSLYLREVEELLDQPPVQSPENAASVLLGTPNLAASNRDVRNLAFSPVYEGSATATAYPAIGRIVGIERARYAASPPNAYDGVLAHPDHLEQLAAEYGDDHQYSASQLEQYAQCPFRFFRERVLRLLDIEAREDDLDSRTTGSVLHHALKQFHEAFPGLAVDEIDPEDAERVMNESLTDAFKSNTWKHRHLSPGVLRGEEARLRRRLAQYLVVERQYGENAWKPDTFELAFGRDEPVAIEANGELVRLRGQIDRIDRNGDAFRLVDYKLSRVPQQDITAGTHFQLTLYAMVADAHLYPAQACEEGVYLVPGKPKRDRACVALRRESKKYDWDERVQTAQDSVAKCVAGIRAARFNPKADEKPCKGCGMERMCRFDRRRLERKANA